MGYVTEGAHQSWLVYAGSLPTDYNSQNALLWLLVGLAMGRGWDELEGGRRLR